MKKVYSIADNIISPLGFTSNENWNNILNGKSGVSEVINSFTSFPTSYTSQFKGTELEDKFRKELLHAKDYTKLEQMFLLSIGNAGSQCDIDLSSPRTLFIFSSTKGNIDLLDSKSYPTIPKERIHLPSIFSTITKYFNNPNKPVIISNACVSGALAIITGTYYIKEGLYDHVVVSGGDIISEFTISGFHCLQALSQGICKPFDKNRDGINLGEACATLILSSTSQNKSVDIEIKGGASSNDANHISGPSRTGDGLIAAIRNCFTYSKVTSSEIGFVSAHGTATPYNDEMEAKAFNSTSLDSIPTNSLKAYFGHTLGAAGVLETVISIWSLKEQKIIASKGYEIHGMSLPLNIIKDSQSLKFSHCLKTASGFGGCNAALVLEKNG